MRTKEKRKMDKVTILLGLSLLSDEKLISTALDVSDTLIGHEDSTAIAYMIRELCTRVERK